MIFTYVNYAGGFNDAYGRARAYIGGMCIYAGIMQGYAGIMQGYAVYSVNPMVYIWFTIGCKL